MQMEAGPSSLRHSSSHLDPLPVSHPLSIKLRTIFDNTSNFSAQSENTRVALEEIEQRYAKERIRSIEEEYDEEETLIDTEAARNNIAKDAQDSLEEAYSTFLGSLQIVDKSLGILADAMNELQDSCNEIEDQLDKADTSTRYLLQHADGLRKQIVQTTQESFLLDVFLNRFTLTPLQLSSIESSNEAIGAPLFAAMDRLQQIRLDSQVLLIGQEEGTKAGMRAGMDIMDETSNLLDIAHQKVARWLHSEMRNFFRDGIDVGRNIREGIKRLEGREELLRPVLKTLATTRGQHVSSSFQRALTLGGPSPTYLPRPIELHAHDPIRYVGDMLAWVHQAVASEREFLSGMFSKINNNEEAGRRPGQRRRGLEGSIDWTNVEAAGLSKSELWTREVLDKVLEGSSRILKSRVEQTLQSQEGCITTFKLASLIQFYRVVMDRTLGSKAILSRTLAEVSVFAFDAFLRTLDRLASGLSRFQDPPEQDLQPPPPVLGACATLRELLNAHEASLSEADMYGDSLPFADVKSIDGKSRDFGQVIQRLVDPILALCRRMSTTIITRKQKGRASVEDETKWNTNIFLVNCLGYIKSVLEAYTFTKETVASIDADLQQRLEELMQLHYAFLLIESGLHGKEDPLAAFDGFLSSSSLLESSRLELLNAPNRRAAVQSRALSLLADEYEKVISVATSPIQRSADEVRILLGVSEEAQLYASSVQQQRQQINM